MQLLLDAGADPEWNGLHDGSLIVMARDRGHARDRDGSWKRRGIAAAASWPDPTVIPFTPRSRATTRRRSGGCSTPIRASSTSATRSARRRFIARSVVAHMTSSRCCSSAAPTCTPCSAPRAASVEVSGPIFRRSISPSGTAVAPRHANRRACCSTHGATRDLTVAAALGDIEHVRQILDAAPARISETRPSGRRPLSAAIEAGHDAIARLLLERGADPNWREPTAPKGRALHAAASAGKRELVELLLTRGADPNSDVDSSGNAVVAAATPEIRALLVARGGTPDPYDTSWIDDDEELRRVAGDPTEIVRVSAAFAMVVGDGRRDRLERLLAAGLRVPPVLTGCQRLSADARRHAPHAACARHES